MVTEEEVQTKVLGKLVEELRAMDAPILKQVDETSNPERALQSLMGKYRSSTVRRYLAGWQHFRKWAQLMTGLPGHPGGITFIDYLYAREEQGLGPSVPLASAQAVGWFESLAGFPDEERISSKSMVGHVVNELIKKLQNKAPPVKRAPRWVSLFIGPMERLVVHAGESLERRLGAWFKLVKLWGSLRFNDAANIKVANMKFYDGCMSGVMVTTKTTGAGKRVRELPLFIAQDAYVCIHDWLEEGFKLWKSSGRSRAIYMFPEGLFGGLGGGDRPMTYQEAVASSADVLESLESEDGDKILPNGWSRFWTEHSERSTLVSGLAAIGIPKSDRDMLGRWQPEGSDQYIRTYNVAVKRMQMKFAEAARREDAYEVLDEGGIFEGVKDWLVEKWSVEREKAVAAVDAWKKKWAKRFRRREEEGLEESGGISTPPFDELEGEELAGESAEESMPEDAPKRRKMMDGAEEAREGAYVIVYRRAGHGTLHRLDASGCWMARKRSFASSEIHQELPEPYLYSTRCKLCWQEAEVETDESTSDSCDDADLTDPES